VWDGRDPVSLDGVLGFLIVCRETGRLPDDVFAGIGDATVDIPVPIEDVEIGGHRVACCSWARAPSCAVEALRFRRKRARIEGRDIGEGLLRLVESLKAKNWKKFGPKLERWREREVAKITAKHKGKSPDALAEACDRIHDQADTLHSFSQGLRSVAALVARIRELFSDSHEVTTPAIVCSSVHKAKGLEWVRVWGLDWTFGGKGKRTDAQEEANIEYVFITRAQKELVRVVRPGERRR